MNMCKAHTNKTWCLGQTSRLCKVRKWLNSVVSQECMFTKGFSVEPWYMCSCACVVVAGWLELCRNWCTKIINMQTQLHLTYITLSMLH